MVLTVIALDWDTVSPFAALFGPKAVGASKSREVTEASGSLELKRRHEKNRTWLRNHDVLAVLVFAQDDTALLNFVVIRDYNGKPIRNASVVMHPVEKNGKQSKGGLQIKTDADGKASFDGVPYGKLRVQVLAPGFQTFGDDYDIDKPTRRDHGQDEASGRDSIPFMKNIRVTRRDGREAAGAGFEDKPQ